MLYFVKPLFSLSSAGLSPVFTVGQYLLFQYLYYIYALGRSFISGIIKPAVIQTPLRSSAQVLKIVLQLINPFQNVSL